MWVHYEPWIDPRRQRAIRFVTRTQGLMVAGGNPLGVNSLADLARPGIRFINRQKGSGTRFLLDAMLEAQSLDSRSIEGYERGEFTHAAVAAFVASGIADVGLGVEPAARQFKLDFIPLLEERYLLACNAESVKEPAVGELIELLKGDAFRAMAETGYTLDSPGEVVEMQEIFPWLKR
jgi:molybdate-binding protein